MPLSTRIASTALDVALSSLSASGGIQIVNTSAEERTAWHDLLPAFVERCRTWKHSATACEYRTNGRVPASADLNESPLCSCAGGNPSPEFLKNPAWQPFARYATRAALSPLFAVSYLESVGSVKLSIEKGLEIYFSKKYCLCCGKRGKMLACSRCKLAWYCSAACQKVHWPEHKTYCGKTDALG